MTNEVKRLRAESQIAVFAALAATAIGDELSVKLEAIDAAFPFDRENDRARGVYQDIVGVVLGLTRRQIGKPEPPAAKQKSHHDQGSLF